MGFKNEKMWEEFSEGGIQINQKLSGCQTTLLAEIKGAEDHVVKKILWQTQNNQVI